MAMEAPYRFLDGYVPDNMKRQKALYVAGARSHAARSYHRSKRTLKQVRCNGTPGTDAMYREWQAAFFPATNIPIQTLSKAADVNETVVINMKASDRTVVDALMSPTSGEILAQPSRKGFQHLNPFTGDKSFDNQSVQILQFYHVWTLPLNLGPARLEAALVHGVILHGLLAYAVVLMQELKLLRDPDDSVSTVSAKALSNVRRYIDSVDFTPMIFTEAVAWLCLGCAFLDIAAEAELHLTAIQSVLGDVSIVGLPDYVQRQLIRCDAVIALPKMSTPILKVTPATPLPDCCTTRRGRFSNLQGAVDKELYNMGLRNPFRAQITLLLHHSELLLDLPGYKHDLLAVMRLYYRAYDTIWRCLHFLNNWKESPMEANLKRGSFAVLLWAAILASSPSIFSHTKARFPKPAPLPLFQDPNQISRKLSSERTESLQHSTQYHLIYSVLVKWNRAVTLLRDGDRAVLKLAVSLLSQAFDELIADLVPSMAKVVRQYLELSLQNLLRASRLSTETRKDAKTRVNIPKMRMTPFP